MHKTIYIDIDEEIIGIIGKIRKENVDEIFLVVPKNSLLTQGIINLKLLKKEVQKMRKKIILVTSDEHSRLIIKRVGLETKNKSVQDFIENEDEKDEAAPIEDLKSQLTNNALQKTKKREIGSSNFYETKASDSRNNNLQNFQKTEEPPAKSDSSRIKVNTPNTFGDEHIKNQEIKKELKKNNPIINQKEEPVFRPNPAFNGLNDTIQKETIDDFYKNKIAQESSTQILNDPKTKKKFMISNKKKFGSLLAIIILGLITISSFQVFSNWPKMTVTLFLKEEVVSADLDLMVCAKKTAESDCLGGNYKEVVLAVSEQYGASGEKFSNDKGMARGIVEIYNNYSSSDQPLIATTRLLSREGKMFRLLKSITVPGIEDGKPGVVEAQIIADQIGQSFNIEASEFTIEGFKGNEKYDKFKVVSKNSTTGGTNDTENKKVKVVTEQDINAAREKTIESFNDKLEKNLKKELGSEEYFVLNSVEKEIINSDSSYAPGDIIDNFNYTIQENIKLITFNKNEFDEIIQASLEKKAMESSVLGELSKISFKKDVANYETKELNLSINVNAIYWPILNKTNIKNDLSDKNNSEVQNYLANLSGIKKASITYYPAWLSTLPIKNTNLNVEQVQ